MLPRTLEQVVLLVLACLKLFLPTPDTRLSLILRLASSPSMAGGGVFEEGGGGKKSDGVFLLVFFLSQPIILFFHLLVVEFCVKLFRALDSLMWMLH